MQTPPARPTPNPAQTKRSGVPLVAVGGVAAVVAGLGAAFVLLGDGGQSKGPPPASEGGLVIDATGPDDGVGEPGKMLRCFVQGQYVGELSLAACAQRNGVATDALDVGLDQSGALAAADQAGQTLTPLPPADAGVTADGEGAQADDSVDQASAQPIGSNVCWRHGGGRWRKVASGGDIDSCVQQLFAGRCEKPGGATYGRYGQQTLRLVSGRVEVSDDNRAFRTLVGQTPDCAIPPVG